MARIVVIDQDLATSIYLKDLEYKQRQSIFPPGQDRYIGAIDLVALQALLTDYGSSVSAADFVDATVGADDISLATLETETGESLTDAQAQALQDVLSYDIVETGAFMLSFDRGQISKLIANNTIKVFTAAGSALYSL